MTVRLALGASLMVVLAGCTASPAEPPRVNEASCAASIFAEPDRPDDYNVAVPGVAVPAAPVLQANETQQTERTLRLFAKWGLIVRTDTVADLQVGPGFEDRARIQWGWATEASPGVAVHVPACVPWSFVHKARRSRCALESA